MDAGDQIRTPANVNLVFLTPINLRRLLTTLKGYSGWFSFSGTKSGLLHWYRDGFGERLAVDHWPAASNEFIELVGHSSGVRDITFHPSEPMVITGSFDRTVRFWNSEDGREVHPPIQTSDTAGDVMLSPDHQFFVTVLRDDVGTIQIRDARTRQVFQEEKLGAPAFAVAFSERGQLMCVSGDELVKVWSYEYSTTTPAGSARLDFELIWKLEEANIGWISELILSPNDRYLAYCQGGGDDPLRKATANRILDVEKRSEMPYRIEPSTHWRSFDFTEKDTRLVVTGFSGGVELWDLVTGKKVKEFKEEFEGESVGMIDVSPDGRYLAFSNDKGELGVFDLREERLPFLSAFPTRVSQTQWNQNGTRIGITLGNDRARVLNIEAIRSQLDELGLNWK